MNNPISDFTDELGEQGKDVVKTFVRDVVKGIPRAAKKQVLGNQTSQTSQTIQTQEAGSGAQGKSQDKGDGKGVDPVTGRAVPKKAQLDYLTKAAAQLQLAKLKKVREELEKQRLKISQTSQTIQTSQTGTGPEVLTEKPKPKDDAVAKTLKASKETGEFKGLIGG